jgi:hypothetical protein
MSLRKHSPVQEILELLDASYENSSPYHDGANPISSNRRSLNEKNEWVKMMGGSSRTRSVRMAERYPLHAKITLRKGTRTLRGDLLNISMLGLFVCTNERTFKEDEQIHVVICPKGSSKNYKVVAKVVRICSGSGSPQGYGLTFI